MQAHAEFKDKDAEGDAPEFGPWLSQASILIVDDEPGMRNFLVKTLSPRCRRVVEACNVEEASRHLDSNQFDVVILDNIMPGKSGVEWLNEQRNIGFFADAILITAFADLETAIQALRAGAVDFVLKPFRSNQILNAVARCLDRLHLQKENFLLRHELLSETNETLKRSRIIGQSPALQQVRETLARVAPMPTSVLITGESGTGKGVAARMLHSVSDRAEKPFVPVNCAAIPSEMIESELFGHLKGAFTGADTRRDGLFLYANEGTLFLDEVGELPLPMQSKLLRVIEDKKIRPLGSEREIPINVRFVFATNVDLAKAVEEGKFRADLFYRMNVVNVDMPPLRERKGDVVELAEMFMHKLSRDLGVPALSLEAPIRHGLTNYDWPGNVRELRNLIERSLILGEFPSEFDNEEGEDTGANENSLKSVERRHILSVLEACGGNRAEAARRLGISRKTIDRKCEQWNV
ncbi:sigma-54-dependent transcriptional regulator [Cohaesibacter gelatinilyticus]|uniref:DNA-binding transcriptional response regulator, NtrC family, contains REC, AAA-type ATPase, and a Fis-type DNA-binding domains n=1 Tax=Cohaesibacter gelatinilyticus TaxID=372072 RepID=A0A285PG60_9HYPH|nr:sigma-54 dependent transcriptional regulator [Cohaesibacter gelatinilyticus]SNZ19136.1 DNA-binding transcriptional response regulator, NtrC family, contains REC, AAA-type ATPase, and a Fis-type DNA-binding domains [Cohaesibacter gelatinilyticus]